jgi:hypothetical protein
MKSKATLSKTALLIGMWMALSACSTHGWYDFTQSVARGECHSIKSDVERSKCLNGNSDSYEQYNSNRKADPSIAQSPRSPVSQPVPPTLVANPSRTPSEQSAGKAVDAAIEKARADVARGTARETAKEGQK